MPSLEDRIRTAALATPALTALLGTNAAGDPFRWYDTQLVQGSADPAVVMQLISNSDLYAWSGRLPTGFSKYQFTIWDTNADRGRQVDAAITAFFTTFNGPGVNGTQCWYGSQIVNRISKLYAATEPVKYQRILEVNIFSNDQAS